MFVITWDQKTSQDTQWTTYAVHFLTFREARKHYEMVRTGNNFGPIEYRNATLARVIESEIP